MGVQVRVSFNKTTRPFKESGLFVNITHKEGIFTLLNMESDSLFWNDFYKGNGSFGVVFSKTHSFRE